MSRLSAAPRTGWPKHRGRGIVAKFYVDWNANGSFSLGADSQADAEDKAYDMVRDYVDARQLGGYIYISVSVEEE
jgi:hypothetical protein